jgi:hypothetical protein
MLASRFFYLSDRVQEIWKVKAKSVEERKIYIGG